MKRHKNAAFLVLSILILSLSWACTGETTQTNPSPAPANSPANTAASPKPEASPAAATGEPSKEDLAKLYESRCAACHKADGTGNKAINAKMPDFTDAKWQDAEKDEDLNAAITNGKGEGKGAMPKWSGLLKPEEIKGLVGHVRTFKK